MKLEAVAFKPFVVEQDKVLPEETYRCFIANLRSYWRAKFTYEEIRAAIGDELGETEVEFDDGTTVKGKFLTRFKKYLVEHYPDLKERVSIADSFWSTTVGDELITLDRPYEGLYEIRYDIDWNPGTFGESSRSCWWRYESYSRGRINMRQAMQDDKAFSLLAYDQNQAPMGRCFCVYWGEDNVALFNAYHKDPKVAPYTFFKRLLLQMMGDDYTIVKNNILELFNGDIYMNGAGWSVVKKSYEPRKIGNTPFIEVKATGFNNYDWGDNLDWEINRDDWIDEWENDDDIDWDDEDDDEYDD